MILILAPDISNDSGEYQSLITYLKTLKNIEARPHIVKGKEQTLTEIYLVGDTSQLKADDFKDLPCVSNIVKISKPYKIIGKHADDKRPTEFTYNGITFSQDNINIFAGLCAVSTREHVESMMKALKKNGQQCTRMGAYKPRTSPYSFQGHGKNCLPYVFELAGKYDIKVIAMEITHEDHIDEINEALELTGNPTGVMLQIGTRNTQNFELLKSAGKQTRFPVLLKRGFGITLEESLMAAEYLASEGNSNIIFALRGMKTNMGDPHRNFVDFAHIPVVKRLTRMPVCIDPSHSVGTLDRGADGITDVMHVTAQGIISGANMILIDFHPEPTKALVDAMQANTIDQLPVLIEDVNIAREAYLKRLQIKGIKP